MRAIGLVGGHDLGLLRRRLRAARRARGGGLGELRQRVAVAADSLEDQLAALGEVLLLRLVGLAVEVLVLLARVQGLVAIGVLGERALPELFADLALETSPFPGA